MWDYHCCREIKQGILHSLKLYNSSGWVRIYGIKCDNLLYPKLDSIYQFNNFQLS